MLSDARKKMKLEDDMKSPSSLCHRLNLSPNERQLEIFEQFTTSEKTMQTVGDEKQEAQRAAAMCALWKILTIPGSSCIIIASTEEQGQQIMGFLEAVCTNCEKDLASICHFSSWSQLTFGVQPGWGISYLTNRPSKIGTKARDALVCLVLGARSSEIEFQETFRALKEHSTHPLNKTIIIW